MAKRLSAAKGRRESFAFAEYKNLRARAHELVRRIDQLERNVVVACSAVFVFSVSSLNASSAIAKTALYVLPPLISVLGLLRYVGLTQYLKEVNSYTVTLEAKLGGSPGWLTHYYANSPDHKGERYFSVFRIVVWGFLIAANVIFAAILLYQR
jgi:hypothetical protein